MPDHAPGLVSVRPGVLEVLHADRRVSDTAGHVASAQWRAAPLLHGH